MYAAVSTVTSTTTSLFMEPNPNVLGYEPLVISNTMPVRLLAPLVNTASTPVMAEVVGIGTG